MYLHWPCSADIMLFVHLTSIKTCVKAVNSSTTEVFQISVIETVHFPWRHHTRGSREWLDNVWLEWLFCDKESNRFYWVSSLEIETYLVALILDCNKSVVEIRYSNYANSDTSKLNAQGKGSKSIQLAAYVCSLQIIGRKTYATDNILSLMAAEYVPHNKIGNDGWWWKSWLKSMSVTFEIQNVRSW